MIGDTGVLHFTVDARHLSQLGEQLVGDRKTALAELVKNAYDADAMRVTIHFLDPAKGGVLEIRDDGEGMDLDTIRDHWMRLSTGNKERNPISPTFKRIRGGKKGIGRFAVHSLGERLVLSTTAKGSNEMIVATFEWGQFEENDDKHEEGAGENGTLLEEIVSPYRIESTPLEEQGTVLRLERLRVDWSENDLKEVRRALQLLQPPYPLASVYRSEEISTAESLDPGFELRIVLGEASEGDHSGIVLPTETDRFLDAATAIVEADVTADGSAAWRIRSDRFELTEEAVYRKKLLLTGVFSLQASYFNYKRGAIGDLSMNVAKKMGNEYGGIRVYRDDLRVPPYGEPGDDWLSLNELSRKRDILFPFANNNWFGHISLSREHNILLVDTASREGVIQNEAFEELRTFVRDVLIDCGRRVAHVRGKKTRARKRELPPPESRKDLVERTFSAAREAMHLAETGQIDEAKAALENASSALVAEARASDVSAKRLETTLVEEIDLLRILSSLGTSIVVFSHEVRAAIDTSKARLFDIEEDAEEAPDPWKDLAVEAVAKATSAIDRLDDLAQFIEGYTSRSRRRERQAQPLHAILDKFTGAFRRLVERQSVKIDWRVEPMNLRTRPMARSELEAILINLLTNALKALEGSPHRHICVTAGEEDGRLLLRFQDSGKGIPEEIRDSLFEPFVTTSLASDDDLGLGTGLGLKIVQDIAEANRGTTQVGTADEGFTTCFEVRLPRGDDSDG